MGGGGGRAGFKERGGKRKQLASCVAGDVV